jgi:hypothetical protein
MNGQIENYTNPWEQNAEILLVDVIMSENFLRTGFKSFRADFLL